MVYNKPNSVPRLLQIIILTIFILFQSNFLSAQSLLENRNSLPDIPLTKENVITGYQNLTLQSKEKSLIEILKIRQNLSADDDLSIKKITKLYSDTYSEELPSTGKITTQYIEMLQNATDMILEREFRNALAIDNTMRYPFSELQEYGVRVISSLDNKIRLFTWNDPGKDLQTPSVVQYYINDDFARCYQPTLYGENKDDEKLLKTNFDSIIHIRNGIYILRGSAAPEEDVNASRIFAFDIKQGIMKKAFIFDDQEEKHYFTLEIRYSAENDAQNIMFEFDGENMKMPVIDENGTFIGLYADYYFNGSYFETADQKVEREAHTERGKFKISRILFKDMYNSVALSEMYLGVPISVVTELAFEADEQYDIEGKTIDLKLECEEYKGSPTISIPNMPIINGYNYVENLDIEWLSEQAWRKRWRFWKKLGPQSITNVAGQDEGMPYQHLRYTAAGFKRTPSKEIVKHIKWVIKIEDGEWKQLDPEKYKGMQIDLVMQPEWREKNIYVAPYIKKPNYNIHKNTLVTEVLSSLFEGGLIRIGSHGSSWTSWDEEPSVASPDDVDGNEGEKEDESEGYEIDEDLLYLIDANKPWDTADTSDIAELDLKTMLKKILPEVIEYAKSDSTEIFYNNAMRIRYPGIYTYWMDSYSDGEQLIKHVLASYSDTDDFLTIGKFLDNKQTFAIGKSVGESTIYFYILEGNQWKEIGKHVYQGDCNFEDIYFEELDGKPGLEILMATYPNMNGNKWMNIYYYDSENASIDLAGEICTDYIINKDKKQIVEWYSGSWYMDEHKTQYEWHDNKLITLRKAILIAQKHINSKKIYLEYYENNSLTPDGLKMVFKEVYKDKKAKHIKYWDDFFELY